MKKTVVYCVREINNKISFFIKADGRDHYLFSQKFYLSVFEFYKSGQLLQNALKSKNRCAHSLNKTAEKLIPYIRFIEQSEGLTILKKTERRLCKVSKKHILTEEFNNNLCKIDYEAA